MKSSINFLFDQLKIVFIFLKSFGDKNKEEINNWIQPCEWRFFQDKKRLERNDLDDREKMVEGPQKQSSSDIHIKY